MNIRTRRLIVSGLLAALVLLVIVVALVKQLR